jgi:hypothetical protein
MKFRVDASYTTYVSMLIEADSLDEAKDIAYNADGGDFKETGLGDWNIDSIQEAI